jgi:hypothetical protein
MYATLMDDDEDSQPLTKQQRRKSEKTEIRRCFDIGRRREESQLLSTTGMRSYQDLRTTHLSTIIRQCA